LKSTRISISISRVFPFALCVMVLPIFLAGCGAAHVSAGSAAPTATIAASPASINAGSSSTLTVTATNATQVKVAGTDGSAYTLTANGGTQKVSPAATTTYTATATGDGGQVSATVIVTVVAPQSPTVNITANPASISAGSSSTLTVMATNATQVTIAGTDGTSYTLAATGGIQVVTPALTTTYTATATGPGGTASAAVTVSPNPPPTVTIIASPASIASGSSSTLTVTASNATQVTIAGTDSSAYTLTANGGTQLVSPATTTTYTVTATGLGGKVTAVATVTVSSIPVVTLVAKPTSVVSGSSSTLTVTATNATQVTLTGTDGSSYNLLANGGTQSVSPTATTTYTATATGPGGSTTASAIVTVIPPGSIQSIKHVIFLEQENHTFDNYFGMLNPYRKLTGSNIGDDGKDYEVDGIDDKLQTTSNPSDDNTPNSLFKLTSTCVQDMSSDWLASFGDVSRYNFTTSRKFPMDGFVHNAEGFANSCASAGGAGTCSGTFPDLTGRVAMGYYDQHFLNYYYYMASQFAVSDRWFSPLASKSIGNRIATFTGGTTQGLVKDPGDDHIGQLNIPTIFHELDLAKVSWKIYFTSTQGFCLDPDSCPATGNDRYPATFFSSLSDSFRYLYQPSGGAACAAPTQPSSVVGDSSNSFCIDPNHIAPLSIYYTDVTNSTLPSFAFIEAGYGNNDEHPGSGQSVLVGQTEAANLINSLMVSPSWKDSAFFFAFDEGGGPYDHVPPVPQHSNDFTSPTLGTIPDIADIAVSPDAYKPCVPSGTAPTTHCDLVSSDPGANPADAAAVDGFAAQLGFRLPNMIISPFTRKHFVSHIPMDHTAVIKFVENRFIGPSAHLTARDAAQPNLLDFFDFNATPWSTPPTPPAPVSAGSLGYDPCDPTKLGP
jgi:phospholipase C